MVLPTLLYGSEAWTTYISHLKALEACYHEIVRICRDDRCTAIRILEETDISIITATTAKTIC